MSIPQADGTEARQRRAGVGRVLIVVAVAAMILVRVMPPAGPVRADSWHAADGPGAAAALTGKLVVYEGGASQDFAGSGTTTYTDGDSTSTGRWGIRDGRYCSVWPPSDRWACYDIALNADGTAVRFTDDSGTQTVGRFEDRD